MTFNNSHHQKLEAELRLACRVQDIASVSRIIIESKDVNLHYLDNMSQNDWTSKNGFVVGAKRPSSFFSIDAINKDGATALHIASEFGFVEGVKLLLKNGSKVNYIDANGQTPLYRAVYHHKLDVAKLLLESGANVDFRDKFNDTVLHVASKSKKANYNRDTRMINLLLKYSPFINIRNLAGETPAKTAFRHQFIPGLRVLLKAGCLPMNVQELPLEMLSHRARFCERIRGSLFRENTVGKVIALMS